MSRIESTQYAAPKTFGEEARVERPRVTPLYDATAHAVLYDGDCRDLLSQIPKRSVKLIVTSPPYNIGKAYEKRKALDEYLEQQRYIISLCVEKLHPHGSICWQVGNFVLNNSIVPLDIALHPVFSSLGLTMRNRIIWHFEHGLHCAHRFSGRYETIVWYTKGDAYTFNLDAVRVPQKYPNKKHFKGPRTGQPSCNPLGKNPGDVWIIPNVKHNHVEKTIHPCQFPVELIERLVMALTNRGDWVLDPFMGVGTTVVAALLHRRRAMGAEVVRDYLKVAHERLELAAEGRLRIRPMARSVYDPSRPDRTAPPLMVKLGKMPRQQTLFEMHQALAGYDNHMKDQQ